MPERPGVIPPGRGSYALPSFADSLWHNGNTGPSKAGQHPPPASPNPGRRVGMHEKL